MLPSTIIKKHSNTIQNRTESASGKNVDVKQIMNAFVVDADHPCVMAQSMIKQDKLAYDTYEDFNSEDTAKNLLKNIHKYIEGYDFKTDRFESYAAAFPQISFDSETHFEDTLWELLTLINRYDDKPWDPTVSNDPSNVDFSFSIKGHAFYIIGLHPKSSRKARQTEFPILVFNLHWQFERLREHGLYNNVRNHIRKRDKVFSGSVNPVLNDFGKMSEAMQYSGKHNDASWKCPFSVKP
ncbi:guanitoxin biosynthesis heme-dependent pre-guanitoxin N-hydroxylase GntA [Changchengzhania lutea]|uniref:guanitoxin biosynthesis heme-dependent pre-guanitoxin N-hydroxylase GntA n=1 Tax=Changchengzhania lutea TaxID=2049305 RepID=UPI00115F1619|nr:guanitoxin biosynthesis heme-dependent pre-guanitoxin N-hydroxylase GntA [Changchengzhania lutea]